jgi:hypothetical protein
MNNNFLQTNVLVVAVILFIIFYGLIIYMQPSFLYKDDGTLRQFGVGYKNKTILPIWLLSFILGIICYLIVLYYLEFQQYI